METYWQNVAAHYALTLEECAALAAHVATLELTAADTSCGIIADALTPAVLAARRAADTIDAALSASIGERIGHGATSDGTALVTLYASTGDYMLTCASTGRRVSYRVNRDAYATPADIPATYRKARTLAAAFQTEHNNGRILASIEAYVEADELYRRRGTFDRFR